MQLLLVEDDAKLGRLLARSLTAEGYTVTLVASVRALEESRPHDFDLAIVDWMLPDGNGLQVCTMLRRDDFAGPILILTARGETKDKVQALDLGADDYLTKPFELDELLARLRALLRRGAQGSSLDVGPLHFDFSKRYAFAFGRLLPLTARELDLLAYLARREGQVVSKAELVEQVWDADEIVVNVVEVHVSRLRDKLGEAAACIETVRGQGYRLVADGTR